MFRKKTNVPSADELQQQVAALQEKLTRATTAAVGSEADLRTAREEIDRLTTFNVTLQERVDQAVEGRVVMRGEDLQTRDLVRVLREELACTHAELKQLKDSVKSVFRLLEPQLGD